MNSLGVGAGAASDHAIPHGVSMLRVLLTLARNAKTLGAYKLARTAYDRLLMFVMPDKDREKMELDMLTIQVSSFSCPTFAAEDDWVSIPGQTSPRCPGATACLFSLPCDQPIVESEYGRELYRPG